MKLVTAFQRHATNPDGLQNTCKDCRRLRATTVDAEKDRVRKAVHYQKHRERYDAATKAWIRRNPEQRAATVMKSYNKDLDRSRARSRNAQRDRMRYTEHRALASFRQQASRARREGATLVDFTLAEWTTMLREYDHRCVYCWTRMTEQLNQLNSVTMDHCTPPRRGGQHTKANIVPACRQCNSRKNGRTYREFIADLPPLAPDAPQHLRTLSPAI